MNGYSKIFHCRRGCAGAFCGGPAAGSAHDGYQVRSRRADHYRQGRSGRSTEPTRHRAWADGALRRDQGRRRVKNLAQVKVGDDLVFKYIEAVSIEIKKGSTGRMETTSSTGPMTAPAGAKPGMGEVTTTTMVANVERVDAAHNEVLPQGPQGRYVEVNVKDPAVMKDVKVGDSVQATYTEALLLEVIGPAKK